MLPLKNLPCSLDGAYHPRSIGRSASRKGVARHASDVNLLLGSVNELNC